MLSMRSTLSTNFEIHNTLWVTGNILYSRISENYSFCVTETLYPLNNYTALLFPTAIITFSILQNLLIYCVYILLSIFPPLEGHFLYILSTMYSKCLEWCLTHSRCSINVWWMNKQLNQLKDMGQMENTNSTTKRLFKVHRMTDPRWYNRCTGLLGVWQYLRLILETRHCAVKGSFLALPKAYCVSGRVPGAPENSLYISQIYEGNISIQFLQMRKWGSERLSSFPKGNRAGK